MGIRQGRDPNMEDEPFRPIFLSASWHNMAASCSRTLFFQSGRVEGIIRSICRTDVSTDLASIRILSRKKKETVVIHYNLKIDENPSRLPVPEKPRLRCFDLDPDRLDCLHLSGFRFADHQHYPLQLPRRAYCNKSERGVRNAVIAVTRDHWMQMRF